MMNVVVVVVCGNIGSGKSTSLGYVRGDYRNNKNVTVVQEDLKKWGYYLDKFYKDKEGFGFLFQMDVMGSYHEVTRMMHQLGDSKERHVVILERSIYDAAEVFIASNQYPPGQKELLLKLCEEYTKLDVWSKAHFVYLDAPVDLCEERVNNRARAGEEKIQRSYLETLEAKYKEMIGRREKSRISTVRVRSGDTKLAVAGKVHAAIKAIIG